MVGTVEWVKLGGLGVALPELLDVVVPSLGDDHRASALRVPRQHSSLPRVVAQHHEVSLTTVTIIYSTLTILSYHTDLTGFDILSDSF